MVLTPASPAFIKGTLSSAEYGPLVLGLSLRFKFNQPVVRSCLTKQQQKKQQKSQQTQGQEPKKNQQKSQQQQLKM